MVFKVPNNSITLRGRMGWNSTGWECRKHVPGREQRLAAGDLVQVAHVCAVLTHCGHSSVTATGSSAGVMNLHLLCPGSNVSLDRGTAQCPTSTCSPWGHIPAAREAPVAQ